jgi:hypothetical protein
MKYTIGTVVSDCTQYGKMKRSFIDAGFTPEDCQYIAINNMGANRFCLYSGGNKIIEKAIGDYIILAHQDVVACYDSRQDLDKRIDELNELDPNWAVAGNAGATEDNQWFVRVTDKYGVDYKQGIFPHKVTMVDGNIIIIKRSSMVAFSNDLSGFHYYGWDICLNADVRGFNSYVIDWHVAHLGDGTVDKHFFDCKDAFEKKWGRAFRYRTLGAFDHDMVTLGSMLP